jgi:acetylglutamate kinase
VSSVSSSVSIWGAIEMTRPLVLKFGGELLEDKAHLATVVTSVRTIAASGAPLVIIHGGGKEIDAALKRAGIEKRQVDGLRITDQATLDIVVSVVAGAVNTRLVAALNAAGVRAVGLTGADASCGLAARAEPHHAVDGRSVDLEQVGVPCADADMRLLRTLTSDRFVPVVACIGIGRDGQLFNVNADTLAGHFAAQLDARRLVIAGATAGVLGDDGATLGELDAEAIADLIGSGTATAGMIAKLRACERAIAGGVADVVIVDGRDAAALAAAATEDVPHLATRIRCLTRLTP